MDKIKLQIKCWEHEFLAKSCRRPTKDDIKANPDISSLYKEYRALRAMERNKQATRTNAEYEALSTPTKKRPRQLETPQKTSPPVQSPKPTNEEIGPTPQLNGRVVGIFDALGTPEDSPLKNEPHNTDDDEFDLLLSDEIGELSQNKVRKLDFSRIMEDYAPEDEITSDAEDIEKGKIELFKTPVKNRVVNIFETPTYLKSGGSRMLNLGNTIVSTSPSPLAYQRMRKGLSVIIDELRDIKEELKYGEYDDLEEEIETMTQTIDKEDDNEEVEESETMPQWRKKKTQKRQTRRVKMKAKKAHEVDEMKGKDVHEEIKRLEESQKQLNDDDVGSEHDENGDDEEEEAEKSEEVYVKEKWKSDTGNKPAQRRNFVKLKINKKKRFFGKRSRW